MPFGKFILEVVDEHWFLCCSSTSIQ